MRRVGLRCRYIDHVELRRNYVEDRRGIAHGFLIPSSWDIGAICLLGKGELEYTYRR